MRKFFLLLPLFTFLIACNDQQIVEEEIIIEQNISDNLLNAVAWYQQSAENTAMYIQAFNTAKNQLLTNASAATTSKPKAVVVDIDETMLDNSPFEVFLIQNDSTFSKNLWNQWVQLGAAKALPGAVDFSLFAEQNDIEVFYISNRHVDNLAPTFDNLKNEGFAFVDSTHILLKSTTSDKTERRSIVEQNYEIIMLIGDNLRDFDELFAERSTDFGKNHVADNASLFGTKYIILPNPMYGEWEKIYRNDNDTAVFQQHDRIRSMLQGY